MVARKILVPRGACQARCHRQCGPGGKARWQHRDEPCDAGLSGSVTGSAEEGMRSARTAGRALAAGPAAVHAARPGSAVCASVCAAIEDSCGASRAKVGAGLLGEE